MLKNDTKPLPRPPSPGGLPCSAVFSAPAGHLHPLCRSPAGQVPLQADFTPASVTPGAVTPETRLGRWTRAGAELSGWAARWPPDVGLVIKTEGRSRHGHIRSNPAPSPQGLSMFLLAPQFLPQPLQPPPAM